MRLFKVVSPRDEIVIGIPDGQLAGATPGTVAAWLRAAGSVEVWQYAVTRAGDGQLAQGPLRRIALLAHDLLRIEPVTTPYAILPPPEA